MTDQTKRSIEVELATGNYILIFEDGSRRLLTQWQLRSIPEADLFYAVRRYNLGVPLTDSTVASMCSFIRGQP